jgi:hypothetical protein
MVLNNEDGHAYQHLRRSEFPCTYQNIATSLKDLAACQEIGTQSFSRAMTVFRHLRNS